MSIVATCTHTNCTRAPPVSGNNVGRYRLDEQIEVEERADTASRIPANRIESSCISGLHAGTRTAIFSVCLFTASCPSHHVMQANCMHHRRCAPANGASPGTYLYHCTVYSNPDSCAIGRWCRICALLHEAPLTIVARCEREGRLGSTRTRR